jgi:small subunit ribosomal protein S20
MANTPQAKKRVRQNEKCRQHNASLRSVYRTHIKKVVSAIEVKKKDLAAQEYQAAIPIIDQMVSKGIVHKNKAARHKSRLSKSIKEL